MRLTGTDAADVVYGEHDAWKLVTTPQIDDTSRWSIHKSVVAQHVPTGKYYEFCYSEGATESQDESPYEYDDTYEPVEVSLRLVAKEKWMPVEQED